MGQRTEITHTTGGTDGHNLEAQSIATIGRCLAGKSRASAMWNLLVNDAETKTHWQMADFVATKKLGMNDHGETHAKVATASALTMLDLLEAGGVQPDFVAGGFGDRDDAALVVLVATLCHDFGNMVHRTDHAELSIMLAIPVLDRLLPEIYPDRVKMTQVKSFILSSNILASRGTQAADDRGGAGLYRGFHGHDEGARAGCLRTGKHHHPFGLGSRY